MQLPTGVEPSETAIVPAGTGAVAVFATVTVKRIVWPYVALGRFELIEVAVGAAVTIWTIAPDVLSRWFASPRYSARMEWLPAASVLRWIEQLPLVRTQVPRLTPSSVKSIVPVAPAGATLAESVMSWPYVEVGELLDAEVVVARRSTVWAIAPELLVRYAVLPS